MQTKELIQPEQPASEPTQRGRNRFRRVAAVGTCLILAAALVACGRSKVESAASTPIAPVPTPTEFSSDDTTCAVVFEGDGIISALERVSAGPVPSFSQEQINKSWGANVRYMLEVQRDGGVELYLYDQAVTQNLMVHPGNRVCHTLRGHLTFQNPPKPENIHLPGYEYGCRVIQSGDGIASRAPNPISMEQRLLEQRLREQQPRPEPTTMPRTVLIPRRFLEVKRTDGSIEQFTINQVVGEGSHDVFIRPVQPGDQVCIASGI